MVEQTVREKVQQAVMEHFQLLAEREVAQNTVGESTSARNEVLNSAAVADATDAAGALKNRSANTAQAKYEDVLVDARKPLAEAQQIYDTIELQARTTMDTTVEKAETAYQAKVDKAQQEYDMELATVEAEVYRAKNEVSSLNDTLSQHRDIVSRQNGIDLNALTGIV